MRKVLVFLILSLFMAANSIANENHLKLFDKWLVKHKFTEFVKMEIGQGEGKCKDLEKFSHLWYYNKCDKQRKIIGNHDINTYNDRDEIPENVKPNFDTLLYYYWKYT
jgi:hypothetical protein